MTNSINWNSCIIIVYMSERLLSWGWVFSNSFFLLHNQGQWPTLVTRHDLGPRVFHSSTKTERFREPIKRRRNRLRSPSERETSSFTSGRWSLNLKIVESVGSLFFLFRRRDFKGHFRHHNWDNVGKTGMQVGTW